MVYFNSIDVKEVDKIFRTMILPQGEIYYKPADFVWKTVSGGVSCQSEQSIAVRECPWRVP